MFNRSEYTYNYDPMKSKYEVESTLASTFLTQSRNIIEKVKESVVNSSTKINLEIDTVKQHKSLDTSELNIINACEGSIRSVKHLIERAADMINELIELYNTNKSLYVCVEYLELFMTIMSDAEDLEKIVELERQTKDFLKVISDHYSKLNFACRQVKHSLSIVNARINNSEDQDIADCMHLIKQLRDIQKTIRKDAWKNINHRTNISLILFGSALLLTIPTAFLLAIYVHPILGSSVGFLIFVSSCFYVYSHSGSSLEKQENYICKQRERYLKEDRFTFNLQKITTPIFGEGIEDLDNDNDLTSPLATAI